MWKFWYYNNNTKIHAIQISGHLYSIQIPQIAIIIILCAMVIICAAELKFIT